jgi:hypothetical protein
MPVHAAVAMQLEVFERPAFLPHPNGTRAMFAIGGTPRPKLSVWTNPDYRGPASHHAARSEPRLGWGKLVGIDPTTIIGGAL